MNRKYIILLALTLGFFTRNLFAQNGVANEEVIVVKEFEATIQDAQKVNIQPNIP